MTLCSIFWTLYLFDLVLNCIYILYVFKRILIVLLLLLICFCYFVDLMVSLSDTNQADVFKAFTSASKNIDNLLNFA